MAYWNEMTPLLRSKVWISLHCCIRPKLSNEIWNSLNAPFTHLLLFQKIPSTPNFGILRFFSLRTLWSRANRKKIEEAEIPMTKFNEERRIKSSWKFWRSERVARKQTFLEVLGKFVKLANSTAEKAGFSWLKFVTDFCFFFLGGMKREKCIWYDYWISIVGSLSQRNNDWRITEEMTDVGKYMAISNPEEQRRSPMELAICSPLKWWINMRVKRSPPIPAPKPSRK